MEVPMWRIRIMVLWLILAICMSASMILFLMAPGAIEDIIAGEMGGMEVSEGMLAVFAIFWIIPFIMAFLALILKVVYNRWANVILGLFFTIFLIVDIAGHASRGEGLGGHVLMGVVAIVGALLIFWHGWKWPKEEQEAETS